MNREQFLGEIRSEKNSKKTFTSYKDALKTNPEYFGADVEFMCSAVEEDYKLIKFDKTNNSNVYITAIQAWCKNTIGGKIFERNGSLKILMDEIQKPREVQNGKYKIPREYLWESIRDSLALNKEPSSYLNMDGRVSQQYGEQLEELYRNPDILVGMHNFTDESDKEQKILKKGLLEAQTNHKYQTLYSTVAYKGSPDRSINFVNMLGYIGASGMGTQHKVAVLVFPKNVLDSNNPIPIWGSEKGESGPNYVLPRYIYGIVKLDENGEPILEKNLHTGEVEYPYLKYDKSVENFNSMEENR